MSVTTTAIFEDGLSFDDRLDLLSSLRGSSMPAMRTVALFGETGFDARPNSDADREWQWTNGLYGTYPSPLEQIEAESSFNLSGPCVSLEVGKRVIDLYLIVRWGQFLKYEYVRQRTRDACHELARIVLAKRIIYIPDSGFKASAASDLVVEGESFEGILVWLREHCGPPAPTIASIYSESGVLWDGDGYYVESWP